MSEKDNDIQLGRAPPSSSSSTRPGPGRRPTIWRGNFDWERIFCITSFLFSYAWQHKHIWQKWKSNGQGEDQSECDTKCRTKTDSMSIRGHLSSWFTENPGAGPPEPGPRAGLGIFLTLRFYFCLFSSLSSATISRTLIRISIKIRIKPLREMEQRVNAN